MKKRVHVAVGVVEGTDGKILISRRATDAHQGGLWEFPGGKVEAGENAEQALKRELQEELGIELQRCIPLIQIRHDYSDKSVFLDVYRVTHFAGEPRGMEGQPIQWVYPAALDDFEFPAANKPIIKAIRLPDRILITGPFTTPEDFSQRFTAALQGHPGLVVMRRHPVRLDLIKKALHLLASSGAALQVNASVEEFDVLSLSLGKGVVGLHLKSAELMGLAKRPVADDILLGASCHNETELRQARLIDVDYAFLSPVLPTASHPEAPALGWDAFAQYVAGVNFPVYALGGIKEGHLTQAKQAGAQGIAAISAWWPSAVRERTLICDSGESEKS